MGILLTTDERGVKIFRKDGVSKNGKNYSLYSFSVSSKDMSGNWISAYIDCRFKKGIAINNGAVIKIKNAFPTSSEFNGQTKVSWMITDFDIISDGETPNNNGISGGIATNDAGFMNIPEGIAENLPFN